MNPVGEPKVKIANETWYQFGNLQHGNVSPNTCSCTHTELEIISEVKSLRDKHHLLASSDDSSYPGQLYPG